MKYNLLIFLNLIFLSINYANAFIPTNFDRLKFNNPDGYAILTQMNDLKVFNFFTEPDGVNSSISTLDTGIHESLHELDSEIKKPESSASYYLISGQIVDAPLLKTFYRREIRSQLSFEESKDPYVTSYLVETGNQGLELLLDELNAYTHGANTTIDLSENEKNKNSINPGLMAIMFFTEKYLLVASTTHPDVYHQMVKSSYRNTIDQLWTQAEKVLNRACASHYGYIDVNDLSRVLKIYEENNRHLFQKFLGHNLKLPSNCVISP